MKDKGHFYSSLVKSGLRMAACLVGFIISQDVAVKIIAAGLFVAEILGVVEELADKR